MRFILFALLILTQCGWTTGWQGALTPNYIIYPGLTATTNQTLSNNQSGNIIVFNGTSSNTKFTLPTATVGEDYTVISDSTNYIHIVIQSGDIINFSTLVAGDGLSNSTGAAKGDSIELACQSTGKWSVKNHPGTWAKDNS